MAQEKKAQPSFVFAGWYRELFSLIVTIALGLLFFAAPHWDPLGKASGVEGALMVCAVLNVVLLYLTVQAWPFVLGRVGSAFSFLLDLLFSILPLAPIVVALTLHLAGQIEQSPMNQIILAIAAITVGFDAIIFGGIGALVNRLTNDLYEMKGRND